MATVYLAIQESVERTVALKLLSKECADRSFGDRFVREAKIASKLVHPNIVTIFDAGSTDEYQYIAMEYIPGQDLADLRFSLGVQEKITVVMEVASALDYANRHGFVHRDIKPSNILIHETDQRAVVTDFGTAKAEESQTRMTMLGETIGTPYFMSPEQAQALNVDGRSDLYSLGVVLYTLLVGEVPFDAQSSVEVGIKHVTEPIPRLPPHLKVFQDFVDRAMAKIPADRFQSGREFRDALGKLPLDTLQDVPIEAPGEDDATRIMPAATPQQIEAVDTSAMQPGGHKPATEKLPVAGQVGGWLEAVFARLSNWVRTVREEPRRALIPGVVAVAGVALLILLFAGGGEKDGEATTVAVSPQPSEASDTPQTTDADTLNPEAEPVSSAASTGTDGEAVSDISEEQDSTDRVLAITESAEDVASDAIGEEIAATATDHDGAAQGVDSGVESGDTESTEDTPVTNEVGEEASIAVEESKSGAAASDEAQTNDEGSAPEQHVAVMLQTANRYLDENALTVPKGRNAYEEFRKVLQIEPYNAAALLGISRIVDKYRDLADRQVEAQDYNSAVTLLQRALTLDPRNAELSAQIEGIEGKREAQVEQWLVTAGERYEQDRLITPAGDNALYYLERVVSQDAANTTARRQLERLANSIVPAINLAISEGRLADASPLIDAAKRAYPNNLRLVELNKRYWDLQDARANTNAPKIVEAGVSRKIFGGLFKGDESGQRNVISLFYRYQNFRGSQRLRLVLLDGDRQTTLGSVSDTVSRSSGRRVVKFENARGFSDGWYELDVLMGQKFLHTLRFRLPQ